MRKALVVSLLLLAMSASVYAGEMGNPAPQPPQTTSTAQSGTEPTGGEMGNGAATAAADITTAETEAAMSLLPALLSLL